MKKRKMQNLANFEGSEIVPENLNVIKGGETGDTGGSSHMVTDLGSAGTFPNDLDFDGKRTEITVEG